MMKSIIFICFFACATLAQQKQFRSSVILASPKTFQTPILEKEFPLFKGDLNDEEISTHFNNDEGSSSFSGVSTFSFDDGSTSSLNDGSTFSLNDGSTSSFDDGSTFSLNDGSTFSLNDGSTSTFNDESINSLNGGNANLFNVGKGNFLNGGSTSFDDGKTFLLNDVSSSFTSESFSISAPITIQETNAFPPKKNSSNDVVFGVFEPLNLPAGASRQLGSIDLSFSCENLPYGYYADERNACRVYHVCYPALFQDGTSETHHYSFMCAEGEVFDQSQLVCLPLGQAIPCDLSASFLYRNEEFGRER